MSIAVENFVKAIYCQSQLRGEGIKLGTLAGLLKITNAAATDMARKLSLKNLVNYTKYKPLSLTATGEEMALRVIRKHRLWETFLHKTLGLSLHEIHEEAEMLEHQTSDFLAEKIDTYLGKPSFDPHGDPIPGLNGKVEVEKGSCALSEVEPGRSYLVCRLLSSDKDFFEFCNDNEIIIGTEIQVEKHYGQSHMTEIIINERKLLLNKELTNIIYVK